MKWKSWMLFFRPDGGDGGGSGDQGDGGGDGGGSGDQGDKNSQGEGGSGDQGDGKKNDADVSGLKSALEKERAAVKEMKAQLRELKELSGKGKEAAEELEQVRGKLAEYEFQEARSGALAKAVEAAAEGGKFSVDVSKAGQLANKLANAETLEADIAEIVDLLKAPVGETPTKQKPAINGQPDGGSGGTTTELDPSKWAEFRRRDPEGYKAMIAERQKSQKFAPLAR